LFPASSSAFRRRRGFIFLGSIIVVLPIIFF
jgi:hypothetical protein